jgi:MerR family mercuric resistance operon transcriptional regulator
MRIGEVASRTGVSVQAVRLYERRGLLKKPIRLASGYRDYPGDAPAFIRFIKRAQGHGFTLDEIRSLIHLREQSPPAAKQMRSVAKTKLAILDERIKKLQTQRDAIAHGLNHCQCAEEFPMCMFTRLVDPRGAR